jgi:hypothetical protein
MNRYSRIPIRQTPESQIKRYSTVKYPEIPLGNSDLYVYITQGNRYDIMAQNYYGDSSLWWVIARSNTFQSLDSIYPSVGAQLRIPSPNRIPSIISSYERLNGVI